MKGVTFQRERGGVKSERSEREKGVGKMERKWSIEEKGGVIFNLLHM